MLVCMLCFRVYLDCLFLIQRSCWTYFCYAWFEKSDLIWVNFDSGLLVLVYLCFYGIWNFCLFWLCYFCVDYGLLFLVWFMVMFWFCWRFDLLIAGWNWCVVDFVWFELIFLCCFVVGLLTWVFLLRYTCVWLTWVLRLVWCIRWTLLVSGFIVFDLL